MAEDSPAIITAHELEVRYNEQVVLNKASMTINARARLGMVGRNGAGKSTMLRILANQQQPDQGTVTRKRDMVVGYLPQDFKLDPNLNVYDNIREGARHVLDLIEKFEAGETKPHDHVEERIQSLDGWTLENRIDTAISRLNVPARDREIDSLSGGEQRRVALCRAIISQPDLLILDEPTNHLDPDSIDWMAGFLRAFPTAFLLVTHDRWFLDNICTSIVEVANGVCYSFPDCKYEDYLEAKAERQFADEQIERKRLAFIRRELDWVRRGPKARTTKSKSRLGRFDDAVNTEKLETELDIELVIPPPPKLGNRVVQLKSVSLELGGKQLFKDFDFTFENKMRIGVAGRNGMGKSSLLKIILGQLQPDNGSVVTGPLTEFNYVDQGRIQLNDEHTVLEEMSDGTEFVVFGEKRLSLRGYLKRFLFTDDRIITQVKYLSGGERSRLLLARILKKGGNFLILDEPTNDLDLATLRILEETLSAFPGTVLVVSHDRYFLNRVCTGILAFEGDSQISYSPGNYDYYIEKRTERLRAAAAQNVPEKVKKQAPKPRPKKLTWNEARELEGMEEKIMEAEGEVERLETIFSAPDFHQTHGEQTTELNKELEDAREAVLKLYARWEELEAKK